MTNGFNKNKKNTNAFLKATVTAKIYAVNKFSTPPKTAKILATNISKLLPKTRERK